MKAKMISEKLISQGYNRIAIYGMGNLGRHLVSELNRPPFFLCGIDKAAELVYSDIKIFYPDEQLPDLDLIIVTVEASFDEIKEILERNNSCKIVRYKDVI